MKRCLIMITLLANCTLGTASFAQDVPDALTDQLKNQGFTVVETGRTWLGRILVRATDGTTDREIVLERGSGQVLHDRARPSQGDEARDEQPSKGASKPPRDQQQPRDGERSLPDNDRPDKNGGKGGQGGGGPKN